jgi:P27 family predicted phage terminase small subunit
MKKIKNPNPGNKIFTFHWELNLADVVERDNFKNGHLQQLAILCDLYSEYHNISEEIKAEGYTYKTTEGRNGDLTKLNPLLPVRDKVLMEIRQYSKLLGLLLKEDKKMKEKPEVKDEWD